MDVGFGRDVEYLDHFPRSNKYNKWTLTPLYLLAFIQLGFGTGGGIKSMLPQTVGHLASTRWRASIWLISGAVNDILIASILSYYLWSQRTVMSSRVVDKLIAYAINTVYTNSLLASLNMRHTLRQQSTTYRKSTGVSGQYTTPLDVSQIRVQMSQQEESHSYSDGKIETLILRDRETQGNNSEGTIPMAFAKSEAEAV
ncbi:hypothetical protein Clacol_001315 [Clathrus columnatus]|uniref:DUF6534 domain-containing protein n=1 Tax=Clathrus columnatus TaxID=1419009 RepID=A0AAV5A282_9AGAM|nr:hypothetical protein Clacol_001315 [Clathrus columnatus]